MSRRYWFDAPPRSPQGGIAATKKIETRNGVRKRDMGIEGDEGYGCAEAACRGQKD